MAWRSAAIGFRRTSSQSSCAWNLLGMTTLKVAALLFLVGDGAVAVVLSAATGSSGRPPPSSCGTSGAP
eukprot:7918598-Lingulodinium_polyedra.AAC.1